MLFRQPRTGSSFESLARRGKCAIFTAVKQILQTAFTFMRIDQSWKSRCGRGSEEKRSVRLHQFRSLGCERAALD